MAANPRIVHNPIDLLLDRLSGVKQTRPDRWQSRCPAHDDRSPSLAITETQDGTILIRCWAGCGAADIVGAVGLELKDLFPPRFDYQSSQPSRKPRYSAAEVVRTLVMEAGIVVLGYRNLQRGEALNTQDEGRVEVAINAIENCREVTR